MSNYRLAVSLVTLRGQINTNYPNRDKQSDGWIGDPAHQTRKSDHNPNGAGVVTAIDITNDPVNGYNNNILAQILFLNRDKRIKYLIWQGHITKPGLLGWKPYTGANAHNHHIHISVSSTPALYDNAAPWDLIAKAPLMVNPFYPVNPLPPTQGFAPGQTTLKVGSNGAAVFTLQSVLTDLKLYTGKIDGLYGVNTAAAVALFQKAQGLTPDGITGVKTLSALASLGNIK